MLSLLRLERKQNNYSNLFRIRIFLFLSSSFGVETISTFIHSRSSLENHIRFQTKMGKVYTRFQTKTAQGSTSSPPPPGSQTTSQLARPFTFSPSPIFSLFSPSPPPPNAEPGPRLVGAFLFSLKIKGLITLAELN